MQNIQESHPENVTMTITKKKLKMRNISANFADNLLFYKTLTLFNARAPKRQTSELVLMFETRLLTDKKLYFKTLIKNKT